MGVLSYYGSWIFGHLGKFDSIGIFWERELGRRRCLVESSQDRCNWRQKCCEGRLYYG
jgi:hypothetical protein